MLSAQLPEPAAFSLYSSNAPAVASSARVEEVRAALDDDTVLVEYFRTADQIVAAVLTRTGLEIVPVGSVPRLHDLTRLLQFQFSKFRNGKRYVNQCSQMLVAATRKHLRELYRELIAPIEKSLMKQHVVLVPHELLHQLPDACFL